MYKLEYLPLARRDMAEIITYISHELHNRTGADRMITQLTEAGERIAEFPYANPIYHPIRPLRRDYRKAVVGNYIMLYWTDESSQTVTVARVIYGRRDYGKLMK